MSFDVVVVGAGPAGATAAYQMGLAGAKVLLLDKAKAFPREKPCGGGLSARLLQRFPYVREFLDAGEVPVNPIRRVHLESPDGTRVTHEQENDPILYLIRRWEFDAALFRRAESVCTVRTGVTIRRCEVKPTHVELETTEGEIITAPLVIGADSANSVIARHTGLRTEAAHKEYAVDMMEETTYDRLQVADRESIYLFLTLTQTFGYGYIFPKTEHLNLGFGCKLDWYLTALRGKGADHHAEWVDTLKQKGDVTGETDRGGYKAFPIPVSGPLVKTYADRVLLAGDAGGFVNAFTAEGIYYAMTSGSLAADVALKSIRSQRYDGRQLSAYQKAWQREIGDDLRHSVEIQHRLFNGSGRMDSLVRSAKSDPELLRLIIGYSMGSARYDELRSYMMRSTVPTWVWSKVRAAVGLNA
ncbi:NAD(P)/FAD-dependent oxidoreductase [Terriglobus aquaticus]|uniref:NAD(P)/FAD-dependent oxidoreductase n=1 Tax=Terriglobus aquaticus TaxID=940139 RepID=A0ABW9KG18_9BACT|nr:geranylgeranyl reductase family protein [Terriglobus aquaticus]